MSSRYDRAGVCNRPEAVGRSRSRKRSLTSSKATEVRYEFVDARGQVTVLKKKMAVGAGEILDTSVLLRPGYTAEVTILIAQESDVIRVPVQAVLERNGADFTFTTVDSPVCDRRPVARLNSSCGPAPAYATASSANDSAAYRGKDTAQPTLSHAATATTTKAAASTRNVTLYRRRTLPRRTSS